MTGQKRWQVSVDQAAAKILKRLPRDLRRRLWAAIKELASDPRPHGYKALKGHNLYRVRVGDWRIIYQVLDKELRVVVVTVGPRGGVYEGL